MIYISLKKTLEGALVLYARAAKNPYKAVVLDADPSSYPGLQGVDYAFSVSANSGITQYSRPSAFQNVESQMEILGTSAAIVRAKAVATSGAAPVVASVNAEVAFDPAVPDLNVINYFSYLVNEWNNGRSISDVANWFVLLKDIPTGTDTLASVLDRYTMYGIFYCAPLLRDPFRDALSTALSTDSFDSTGASTKFPSSLRVMLSFMSATKTSEIPTSKALGLDAAGFQWAYGPLMDAIISSSNSPVEAQKSCVIVSLLLLKCFTDTSRAVQTAAKNYAHTYLGTSFGTGFTYSTLLI